MNLMVDRASAQDLTEAEALMREVLANDLGGYVPKWHADLDDLAAAYFGDPQRSLFIARVDGVLVGTAAVKPCSLRTPPNPQWLADRYNDPSVCELARVWIGASGRRRGVGRSLVRRAVLWATREAGYQTVYLHTDANAPGAEPFWRSLPTVEVYDARPDPFNCLHFVIDVDKLGLEVPAP